MTLYVANYTPEHWSQHWISINGESIEPTEILVQVINAGDIIQIPLSHPSTIVNGTTYDSGAHAETVIAYEANTSIEVSTDGPELPSAATVYSLKITVGGGRVQ